MMRTSMFIITCAVLLTANTAIAQPFTALWVFGDSTVDTGWYKLSPSGFSQYDMYFQAPADDVGKPTSSPEKCRLRSSPLRWA